MSHGLHIPLHMQIPSLTGIIPRTAKMTEHTADTCCRIPWGEKRGPAALNTGCYCHWHYWHLMRYVLTFPCVSCEAAPDHEDSYQMTSSRRPVP
eukprot:1539505-Amphidinium_carterae.1